MWGMHSAVKTPRSPRHSPHTLHGTILAFDFGKKRIGVAMGELELKMAHPLTTISEKADARFQAIEKIIQEWQPVRLVVGLPLHMDGTEHEMTEQCRRFARQLQGRFNLETELVDERLTSAEAASLLADMGRGGQDNKHLIDQLAAQRILQAYFDQNA
jgi:putative Holliday junction resolvase